MIKKIFSAGKVYRFSKTSFQTTSLSVHSFVHRSGLPFSSRTALSASRPRSSSVNAHGDSIEAPPEFELIVTKQKQKSSFLKKAQVKESISWEDVDTKQTKKFTNFKLDTALLDQLEKMDFVEPTPVQTVAIDEILSGENCAIQSYTGSGKTLAYLLPVLTQVMKFAQEERHDKSIPSSEKGQLQALIVSPSRELAMQIVRVAESLLPADSKTAVQQLIGGANPGRQVEGLRTKPSVVVGTPGRLADHSRKGTLLTHKCPILILDEVDQLIDSQFREDMLRVTENTGKKLDHRQTIVVSATLTPPFIERIGVWAPQAQFVFIGSTAAIHGTDHYITEKKTIVPQWGWGNKRNVNPSRTTSFRHASISMPPNIHHGYVVVESRKKIHSLRRAIYAMNAGKCLVFMNFTKRIQDVLFKLSARGMPVGTLHGNKDKLERAQNLHLFKDGNIRALVVSDIAARGLDIIDCDAVFNVELPTDASHYAHRAGRTGRMGREGWVLSFVDRKEIFVINKLAKQLKIEIPQVDIWNGEVSIRIKESSSSSSTH